MKVLGPCGPPPSPTPYPFKLFYGPRDSNFLVFFFLKNTHLHSPEGIVWAMQMWKCVLSFSKHIGEAIVYSFSFPVFSVD